MPLYPRFAGECSLMLANSSLSFFFAQQLQYATQSFALSKHGKTAAFSCKFQEGRRFSSVCENGCFAPFCPPPAAKKTPGPSLAKGGTGRLEDAEKIRPRARTYPCPPRTGGRRNPRAGLPSGCRRRCRFRAHRPARRRYNRKQCRRNVS